LTLVIDASVTLSWHFDDEARPNTNEIYGRILRGFTHAPAIWLLEVTNALVLAVRRQRIPTSKLDAFIDELDIMPLTLHQTAGSDRISVIIDIATQHRLTTYDAAYLELAQRLKLPLATYDQDMGRAAKAMDLALFEV